MKTSIGQQDVFRCRARRISQNKEKPDILCTRSHSSASLAHSLRSGSLLRKATPESFCFTKLSCSDIGAHKTGNNELNFFYTTGTGGHWLTPIAL